MTTGATKGVFRSIAFIDVPEPDYADVILVTMPPSAPSAPEA
ncbi:hypothetical protein [Pseudarthrobacter sp. N5]